MGWAGFVYCRESASRHKETRVQFSLNCRFIEIKASGLNAVCLLVDGASGSSDKHGLNCVQLIFSAHSPLFAAPSCFAWLF